MCEMLTCESSTQVYLFLLRTFVHDAHTVLRLRYLGYDRACDLKPYLEKQARQGGAGAKLFFLFLFIYLFLLNKFVISGYQK